ncbi:hypothetical protein L1280_002786 [Deinococcus sp. HSC-46F16]|uniref:hypothetical protein n=1 Tax=Deinococcus sp. HSC-46F16 TaxID=2910968 RepID=UPI00209DC4BF|nr:hypothetical protein [Deinococcus sp. HSC-46F16]MCP2015618.1 hypothetical protein [Deinococcus sp. HSC-46F16]
MTGEKKYILRDGEEPGIYQGIGDVRVGVPFRVYSEEQERLVKEDKRFKQYTAPAEGVTDEGTVKGRTAKAGNGGKE